MRTEFGFVPESMAVEAHQWDQKVLQEEWCKHIDSELLMKPLDGRLVRVVWEHDPGVVKYQVQALLFERNSPAVVLIVERSLRFSGRNWTSRGQISRFGLRTIWRREWTLWLRCHWWMSGV